MKRVGRLADHGWTSADAYVLAAGGLVGGSCCHPGYPNFPATHDLGADSGIELPSEGVVDPVAAAWLGELLEPVPPPGGKQPIVQAMTRVTEGCVAAKTCTGAEAV